MTIIKHQEKLLKQIEVINGLNTYDNSIEPINNFPALILEPITETRYNLALGSAPHKCKFQVYIADITANNELSITKTRQSVANILQTVANAWQVNLDGEIGYSAVKIDNKNAILCDFVITT